MDSPRAGKWLQMTCAYLKQIGFQLSSFFHLCMKDSRAVGSFCCSQLAHYDNTPMQYTAIFHGCKNGNIQIKIVIFFLFLLKT